jgi:formate hydrogenlyase subunit 6/NADH:ubiquinone oxidoreductase subunit I
MQIIEVSTLDSLFKTLRTRGYSLIGPTIQNDAIIYDEIEGVNDLPRGWTDVQVPASYTLRKREDEALFGYVVGPYSWKRFLFPPRLKLFGAAKAGKSFQVNPTNGTEGKNYAFIGVRPCELAAIAIQDKVFRDGPYADRTYTKMREQAFIVAVNCMEPGGNCFCASMDTGPEARAGYDLVLTEVCGTGEHYFAIDAGSKKGEDVLAEIPHRPASDTESLRVREGLQNAGASMIHTLDTTDLPKILSDNFEHPHWDSVAKRCLSCANCTLVCPTCFCSTVEDTTDLTGSKAERWRRWDSCFTADFTRIAGGNIRMSTRTRYRQWLTHKLGNWVEQFGTSGCVGCGRCITWCPVGIDLTEEVAAIREASGAGVSL